jgi:hypothetical protein
VPAFGPAAIPAEARDPVRQWIERTGGGVQSPEITSGLGQ